MLYVVLWVESPVIIMLLYDTGMLHVFCDNPRYVLRNLFHLTAGIAAYAAILYCHELLSTGFGLIY